MCDATSFTQGEMDKYDKGGKSPPLPLALTFCCTLPPDEDYMESIPVS